MTSSTHHDKDTTNRCVFLWSYGLVFLAGAITRAGGKTHHDTNQRRRRNFWLTDAKKNDIYFPSSPGMDRRSTISDVLGDDFAALHRFRGREGVNRCFERYQLNVELENARNDEFSRPESSEFLGPRIWDVYI